jgi:hypothetical protein
MPRRSCVSLERAGIPVHYFFGDELAALQHKAGVSDEPFALGDTVRPALLESLEIRSPRRAVHYLFSRSVQRRLDLCCGVSFCHELGCKSATKREALLDAAQRSRHVFDPVERRKGNDDIKFMPERELRCVSVSK